MKYVLAVIVLFWIGLLVIDFELAIVALVSGASMVLVNIAYRKWEVRNKEIGE